jgi:hypothetical protein
MAGFPVTHMGTEKLPATVQIKFRPKFQQIVMSVTQMSFDIRSGVAQKDNKRAG